MTKIKLDCREVVIYDYTVIIDNKQVKKVEVNNTIPAYMLEIWRKIYSVSNGNNTIIMSYLTK